MYSEIINNIIENIDKEIHFMDKDFNTIIYNNSMARLEDINKNEVINKSFIELDKTMKIKNSTLVDVIKNKKSIKDNV